ncbi:MAG TPA: T9SS type A sorting domain-containing protein [Saprospiraceae bacterium]|nr:T9SS type A sorting domain-containing protein [Saprospiraceae bacterium]
MVLLGTAFHPLWSQSVSAGGRHSLAICSDSTTISWGYNGFGQLGDGSIIPRPAGLPVASLSGIQFVAGGLFHSLFVHRDGRVWASGRNTAGPLGDGSQTDQPIPVPVLGLTDIIQAAGGGEHSLFIKKDGTVYATGRNSAGQLGDGTSSNRSVPVNVKLQGEVVQIAGGAEYSLFLKADGTVWACGHNGYGQLGLGSNTSTTTAVRIPSLNDVIRISAGEWHSLFVKKDGTVWACGRNQYGQLGDGSTMDRNSPVPITSLSGITDAEAGGIHSVFVKNDGSAWACGLNSGGNNDGQLGNGNNTDQNIPVQVIPSWGANRKVIRAEATREHSLFLTDDHQIWACGRNNYGQLGYGTATTGNSLVPVLSTPACALQPVSTFHEKGKDIPAPFPNPSGSGIFQLDLPGNAEWTVTVTNINRQAIVSNQKVKGKHRIDLSDFPKGMYWLFLRSENAVGMRLLHSL